MPVKRRTDKRRPELAEDAEKWLRGEPSGAFVYLMTPGECVALWDEYGDQVVAERVVDWPGTRPERWWQYSAPEPRRRVGGVGTPAHERLADVEHYHVGVPWTWITCSTLATYRLIGRDLGVPAISPAAPPLYESEATYLERLDLLLPGERRRLAAIDFHPESVLDILGLLNP
jgi:hypothetical protein